MEMAEDVVAVLNDQTVFEKIEVAEPGYINFYLSEKYLQDVVGKINAEKNNFGNSQIGKNIKVNNEFISANPTGPLHLGNGRGGFYGDCLSKVLRKAGFEVTNEYFINDAGEQIMKLGHSVLKDSEAVYIGEYINELNEKYKKITDVQEVGRKAAKDILENSIKKTIEEKMQISFDVWMSEKEIQEKKYVDKAIDLLQEKKLTYESEGALWLKTTEFGDDKDRVLIKKDKNKTYFATDCGYILNKKERSFDKIIEIWGADHHGYVNRFQAAAEALGFQKEQTKFIIVQLVRLVKDGKEARMSKRAGNVVYIDDLIEEVGHDVTRFFFLMYSPDTHMNFDLGLAKEQSQKNPIFYVQYAYARICSIIRKAQETMTKIQDTKNINMELLIHEKELSLIKELNKFPELIEEISENYEVHKLPHYAIRLADKFHSFYDACRVIDEGNPQLSKARLSLVNAAKIVLAETLNLIGVSTPEKM
jgi:arginyl-tRNA synthetase